MVTFPKVTSEGALYGLKIWLFSVIPTLFPYIVILNIMFSSKTISYLANAISPVITKAFKCSKQATTAILAGYMCGFPMGAKVTCDLYKENQITLEEANYLLTFCNNPSPAFIICYINNKILFRNDKFIFLLIIYLSSYICSILKRNVEHIHNIKNNKKKTIVLKAQNINTILLSSVNSIVIFGIYIIFSTIISFYFKEISLEFISPFIEITSGLSLIKHINNNLLFLIAVTTVSFGGLSTILQTISVIGNSSVSKTNYIFWKIINSSISLFIALIYISLK